MHEHIIKRECIKRVQDASNTPNGVQDKRGTDMSEELKVYKEISELTPNARIACELFMADCKEKGLKVRITETYRSQERQNYLYEQGRTRPGNKVTWTKNSRHTGRRAWDICQNIKGKEYSDAGFFVKCGKIAEKLGITWGGTWKQADTPHFEVSANWKAPEEEIDMEEIKKLREEIENLSAEVKNLAKTADRLADRVTKLENPMIYNYIDKNMPDWAVDTIKKLAAAGILSGDGDGLALTDEMLRLLVILDRSGTFDKIG